MFHPGCHFGGGRPEVAAGRFFGTAGASWQRSGGSLSEVPGDCQSPAPCPPVSNTSGTAAFPLLLGWSSIKAACKDESTIFTYSTTKLLASTASLTLGTLRSALFERPDSTPISLLE